MLGAGEPSGASQLCGRGGWTPPWLAEPRVAPGSWSAPCHQLDPALHALAGREPEAGWYGNPQTPQVPLTNEALLHPRAASLQEQGRMLLPEGSRHREHPASLGVNHLLRPAGAATVLHPQESTIQCCKCPASLWQQHSSTASILHPRESPLWHCEHPASPGISPPALQASCIPGHPFPLAPCRGGDEDRCKDGRKRSQTPRPPRLRAARSKAQLGSELLACTVCQSQKRVWRVAVVGFPCSQSQPEMLCADWGPHSFPKSHFPSCSSLSTSHPHPAPAGSRLCIHPGSIISEASSLINGGGSEQKGT